MMERTRNNSIEYCNYVTFPWYCHEYVSFVSFFSSLYYSIICAVKRFRFHRKIKTVNSLSSNSVTFIWESVANIVCLIGNNHSNNNEKKRVNSRMWHHNWKPLKFHMPFTAQNKNKTKIAININRNVCVPHHVSSCANVMTIESEIKEERARKRLFQLLNEMYASNCFEDFLSSAIQSNTMKNGHQTLTGTCSIILLNNDNNKTW